AELLANKKKSIKAKDARDAYLKLLRFGAGRGFESNLISRCLQQLVKGGDDETME
ncbi:MAG TPA: RecX family transcriptional regulator, partial [Porphyromonadaceae bacterium]|nr:RecX family transcriptional regulator [Porphyromonadaceae bacterium]